MPLVAFFIPYPHGVGGMERVTEVLATSLLTSEWEVVAIAPSGGRFVDRLRRAGVEVVVVTAPAALRRYGGRPRRSQALVALAALLRYWWRLRRALVCSGAAVVHTGEHRGALLAGPAARLARVPLVWQIHSVEASWTIRSLGALLATRVVVPSAATTAAIGPLPRRAAIVPNPVAPGPTTDGQARRGRGEADLPVVLACGRLHPVKGYDVLLEAVARLRDRGLGLRLVVLGQRQPGHEAHADDLERQCRTNGLADVVEFAGHREKPFESWPDAAVYVQPSRHETFGLAAAEAMAAGLPVVVSGVGGLAELVQHERTGLVVRPSDPAGLADAIERLLVDRGLAGRLADTGRAEVGARFGRSTEAIVAVYEEALRSRTRR